MLKLWVLNLKINTNLQNTIPEEGRVIVSRKLQICKKGNQNKSNPLISDATDLITLGMRWMETPEREQRPVKESHYFSVSENLVKHASLRLGFSGFLFNSKFFPHQETLHLTTWPNVDEWVVGSHQLVKVKFISKPFPFCFMKDPLVVIVSVKTEMHVNLSCTHWQLVHLGNL